MLFLYPGGTKAGLPVDGYMCRLNFGGGELGGTNRNPLPLKGLKWRKNPNFGEFHDP